MKDMIRDLSPSAVNAEIDRETLTRLDEFQSAPEKIQMRLTELSEEYDVECFVELFGSAVSLLGIGLATRNRKWLALPAVASGLVLLHSLPAPDPLTPLFRAFGIRSRQEIERERMALKLLRGDYKRYHDGDMTAKDALTAAQGDVGLEEGSGEARVLGNTGTTKTKRATRKRSMRDEAPLGEDLKPNDVPTVSGPSGDTTRH